MIAQIITLVATLATFGIVIRARPAVQFTTLVAAWVWAVIAAASWVAAAVASFVLTPLDSVLGQFWYVAAVLTLCPWIAVLGARRPTVRVWNWFVIAPLIAVLLWPVALSWTPMGPNRLTLATPHLVGFGLVLVMGMGNYVGTRFTILACLTLLAELILIVSLGPRSASDQVSWFRAMAATIQVCGAVMSGFSISMQNGTGWNGLWQDFRDAFGIVWANRIAGRINAEAEKENWTVRLHSDRFVSATPDSPPSLTRDGDQINQTMRWLLRRFVDDEWINARVWPYAAPGLKEGGSLAGKDSIDASSTLS